MIIIIIDVRMAIILFYYIGVVNLYLNKNTIKIQNDQ